MIDLDSEPAHSELHPDNKEIVQKQLQKEASIRAKAKLVEMGV